MKKMLVLGILAAGLLSISLISPIATAGGFVHKSVECPKTGFLLIPPGARLKISDLIISSSGATEATIFYNPPRFQVLTAFLDANETVVTNFTGQVEGERGQALKMTCSGVATVSVTIVGTEAL
jgi:hypothetical protein